MDGKDKKRKHMLFKADDGRPDSLKPCAFFASPDGCRNGANCRFMHEIVSTGHTKDAATSIQASKGSANDDPTKEKKDKKRQKSEENANHSAIASSWSTVKQKPTEMPSSESAELRMLREQVLMQQRLLEQNLQAISKLDAINYSNNEHQAAATITEKKTPEAKKEAKKERANAASLAAAPLPKPVSFQPSLAKPVVTNGKVSQPIQSGKMDVDNDEEDEEEEEDGDGDEASEDEGEDDDEQFLFDAVNHVIKSGVNQTTPDGGSHRNLSSKPNVNDDLFVSPVVAAASKGQTLQITKKKDIFASNRAANATTPAQARASSSSSTSATVSAFNASEVNFPQLPWEDLVGLTAKNAKFETDYAFQTDASWVKPRSRVEGAAKVIAIDCEMCETIDPVTNDKCSNSLIRFSVVDGYDPSNVLIDSLVSPSDPITDARTRIHGITKEALAGIRFSLRHAQAALLKIIDEQTIIIGHALHFDLKALRFQHRCCIDTACIYLVRNPEDNTKSTPGLRMVAGQVLGMKMRSSHHDSIEDARVSLYAAAYFLHSKGKTPALIRPSPNVGSSSSSASLRREKNADHALMVHHIPSYCSEEHIERMIVEYTNITPQEIKPIVRSSILTNQTGEQSLGKTMVYFSTARHAELAFDSIAGSMRPDKANRPQKRVYLKSGEFINVRK